MLLGAEPRLFDIDLQILHNFVLSAVFLFFVLPVIIIFIIGSAVIIKFLIKKLREK